MNYYEINTRIQKFQAVTSYRLLYGRTHRTWEIHGWSDCVTFKKSEVFVSGIPSDTLEDELIPFFATIGVVVKFKLLTLQNSLYNSGFAVVTYCDSPVADIAVKVLNYAYFNGIILTVEKVSDNCRLFLGGIPETKSKDEVWRALSRYGITGIVDVIMYRSYRNRAFNRGYVFIEFHTYVEAAQVRVLYKNLVLWGEKMAIDWSEPIPSVTDDIMCKMRSNIRSLRYAGPHLKSTRQGRSDTYLDLKEGHIALRPIELLYPLHEL
ncbi:heterogeneous nuclear ribonucleoprotein [Holotrichia oblita]|uniref:Heterogeneous nuclear ribonucleoprotein n=1 Tax=Holotrichia oblita TaxID=644536 RepID=A0ACB9TVN9_HOLOL|nr:heterogeneous nuclear ribonucleoprotein [Holotrichia oblita]